MKPDLFPCCRGILFILFILLTAAGSLIAAPPANDNFANRINLGNTFPTSATGTNVDATEQIGEPLPIDGLSTVWWRWTAVAARQVEVNTAGSLNGTDPLDTVLAVYTGTTLTSLVQVAVNDESAAGYNSVVRFTAVAGTAYVIQVLGWQGAEGTVKLNLKAGPPLPANDAFASAVTLTNGTAASGTTDGATLQASEAVPLGIDAAEYSGSSWWAWTAPSAGWYRLSVAGAGYNQVASVWTGTAVNALTAVHSNHGGFEGLSVTLEVYFSATTGTRYPIAVGNLYGAEGLPVSLTISNVAMPPVHNANLTVSAGIVNVSSAPATVNVVFRMVSANPIVGGNVEISTISGFFKSIDFSDVQRTSGSSTDGTYTVPILFPRYLAPGIYRISSIGTQGDFYHRTGELSAIPFAAGVSNTVNVSNTGAVDTAGPTVTSVSVTPTTVDVTTGPKTITAILQISDLLSGFKEGSISIGNITPFGTTYNTFADFGIAQRTEGTPQNGTYVVNSTVRADAIGDYFLMIDGVKDENGNFANSISSTDPAFPGPFTGTFRVNRTPVHVLNSFTLTPPSVNVTTGAVNVTATCSITTTSGQFGSGYLRVKLGDGNYAFDVSINSSNRTSGTDTSGTYTVTLPIPRYLVPGLYRAELYLSGTQGESSPYEAGKFAFPAGANTGLNVTNTGAVDTTPPAITFISAAPNFLIEGSNTPLVVRLRVTDDLSGVQRVRVYLASNISGVDDDHSAVRISGTALDGIWEFAAPVIHGTPPGVYAINLDAQDVLNQTTYFTTNPAIPAQSVTITAAANGYDTWTSANSLTGTDALATSDPDRDGTGNLMEFAMGMNPQARPVDPAAATAAGLPAATLTGSGAARHLTLGFWVPADLSSTNQLRLAYLAQFSSNGTSWTDVAQTSFAIDAGTSLNTASGLRRFCTVTDPAPYSASQPRFGRIRATVNP